MHAALERARVDPDEVEDVVIVRQSGRGDRRLEHRAPDRHPRGFARTVAGMTVNRFCSSGLAEHALAAQRIMSGEGEIYVAGGVEPSRWCRRRMNKHHFQDEWMSPAPSETYGDAADGGIRRPPLRIPREKQRTIRRAEQQRAAKARAAGKFKDEIVSITTKMKVVDKNTGQESSREVTVAEDEGIRADTTYEGCRDQACRSRAGCHRRRQRKPFSDGRSAALVMSDKQAARRG